ncbi:MAG: hypothetical protein WKG01_40330 [Kofleriaceae bacterium]
MRSRWVIVALALIAASAFALSVQGGRWWVVLNVEIGPFGSRRCFADECGRTGLSWIGAGEGWMRLGMAIWAAGLLSMAILVVMSAAIAAGKAPRLIAKIGISALVTAMLVGALFVAKFPGVDGVSIGRGIPLFGVAIVFGLAAAILTVRRR